MNRRAVVDGRCDLGRSIAVIQRCTSLAVRGQLGCSMLHKVSFLHEQVDDLGCDVTFCEIKKRFWDCGSIKSPVRLLKCFFLASGLQINILKSKLMGIGVIYGRVVWDSPSRRIAWDVIIGSDFQSFSQLDLYLGKSSISLSANVLNLLDAFEKKVGTVRNTLFWKIVGLMMSPSADLFLNPRRGVGERAAAPSSGTWWVISLSPLQMIDRHGFLDFW
ncbi:hypothetical protein Tco_0277601 [Tanacetum coccineum]